MRSTVTAIVLTLLGAGLAHQSQRAIDPLRRDSSAGQEMLFAPDGATLRVTTLDYAVHAADLLWVRAVLSFGERYGDSADEAWGRWFDITTRAVIALDPQWRTPYVYGGSMLRVMGMIPESTAMFKAGHEALPKDWYFPFAVGMNYYMHLSDPEEAARWLQVASEIEGAPSWYAVAAVAFRERKYERQQAIHFLREELAATSDPELRQALQDRLNGLMHDEMSDRLSQLVDELSQRRGRPVKAVEELVRARRIDALPEDPMGGTWIIDIDGKVRSSVAAETLAKKALRAERAMLRAMK